MTAVETAKVLTALHAAYPRQQPATAEMAETTITIWHDTIGHLPYDVAEVAARRVLATSKFMPSIAEFLESAANIQTPNRLTAGEAWAEVCHELRRVGSWGTPQFSAPLIAHAVEAMGGWKQLCASEEPEVDRAHFLKIYGAIDERARAEDKLPPQVRQIAAGLAKQLALPGTTGG